MTKLPQITFIHPHNTIETRNNWMRNSVMLNFDKKQKHQLIKGDTFKKMNTLNIKPKFVAKEIWVDRQPEMMIMALCPEHTWEINTFKQLVIPCCP